MFVSDFIVGEVEAQVHPVCESIVNKVADHVKTITCLAQWAIHIRPDLWIQVMCIDPVDEVTMLFRNANQLVARSRDGDFPVRLLLENQFCD